MSVTPYSLEQPSLLVPHSSPQLSSSQYSMSLIGWSPNVAAVPRRAGSIFLTRYSYSADMGDVTMISSSLPGSVITRSS